VSSLRGAERSASVEICALLTRVFALDRRGAQQTVPEESPFIYDVVGRSGSQRKVKSVIVNNCGDKGFRRREIRNLHQQVIGQVALDVETRGQAVIRRQFVIDSRGPQYLLCRLSEIDGAARRRQLKRSR